MRTPVFNPVSTSGAGFQLEHYVQASYVASLVLQTPLPLRDGLVVEQLVFQGKHQADTDDLIAHLTRGQKQFIQSKHGFEINANTTFFEVIENCWNDYQNGFFKPGTDLFIITTQALTKADAEDGLVLLEWARFSHSAADFRQKVSLNKKKQAKLRFFQRALAKANGGAVDQTTEWKFLKSFFIRTFDYLESGSRDREILKWYLQPFIKTPATAEQVLAVLLDYVAACNQHGATVTAHSLPANIREMFDLKKNGKPWLGTERVPA